MTDKQICKRLGVSPPGLHLLAKAVAQPDGRASGNGFGAGSGSVRVKLRDQGFVESGEGPGWPPDVITQAGRNLVAEARNLGW